MAVSSRDHPSRRRLIFFIGTTGHDPQRIVTGRSTSLDLPD
jgi:hypothetical protein